VLITAVISGADAVFSCGSHTTFTQSRTSIRFGDSIRSGEGEFVFRRWTKVLRGWNNM